MANRGMTEFTTGGVDYTINDPNNEDEFSASIAYKKGQFAYHEGNLFKFVKDHAAGAWNPSDVHAVRLARESFQNHKSIHATSRELVDRTVAVISGHYFNNSGKAGEMNNYSFSIARVEAGESFIINGSLHKSTYHLYYFLDSDRTILENGDELPNDTYFEEYGVTAPAGAKYLIVNSGEGNPESRILKAINKDTVEWGLTAGKGVFADCLNYKMDQYFRVDTNSFTTLQDYRCIVEKCQPGDIFKIKGYGYCASISTPTYTPWIVRNSNGEIIVRSEMWATSALQENDGEIVVVPADGCEFIVNITVNRSGYCRKWIEDDRAGYHFAQNNPVVTGRFFNAENATYQTLSGYKTIEDECDPGDIFHVIGASYATTYYNWVFLNALNQIILHPDRDYHVYSFNDEFIIAPEGAKKIIVTSGEDHENFTRPIVLAKRMLVDTSSDASQYFRTSLYGKRIVWFGTSIPAGAVNGKTYPALVGEKLGATVFNEALGSSPMSDAVPVNESRLRALALTEDEKQAKDWYSELTDAQKAIAISSSFDHKFTKYLTGGSVGPVDLYVFDHGYNDYYYLDPSNYMTEPDDPNDKSYPLGAANFLINAILQDNPRAKIVWIGHYENALDDPTDHQSWGKPVAELQEYISEKYGIPLCKVWENTGWSNPHKITTTGYWSGQTWIPSGGTSRQDYVKNCAFADGIHPNTDGSGESTNRYATIIADWLRTVF